jgi:hypothetical protein
MSAAPQHRPLPNRRPHLVLNFEHGGFAYTAGIGFFDDASQQPAEIFPLAHTLDLLDQQGAAE